MKKGISIRLTGHNPRKTARALCARLTELNRHAQLADDEFIERLGSIHTAGFVCGLLSKNGVIVVVSEEDLVPEGEALETEISANDTPEFAAEKTLDQLSERGLVDLDEPDYSPEEEEEIRKRLADLGYIE